jgi:hypothetical protein
LNCCCSPSSSESFAKLGLEREFLKSMLDLEVLERGLAFQEGELELEQLEHGTF